MTNPTEIYGIHAITEAVKSGKSIDKVFIQKNLQGNNASELLGLLKTHHIATSFVPVEKLNRLSSKNHQGVIAYVSPVQLDDFGGSGVNAIGSGKAPFFARRDERSAARAAVALIRPAPGPRVHERILQRKGGLAE